MEIKPSEVSVLIKAQIKDFDKKVEDNDVGTVVTYGDGIAIIYGLNNAMNGELLVFPHDVYGLVMNLNEDSIGAVLFGNSEFIKEGDVVKRTKKVFEVPVGEALLGRVVDALGRPIDGKGPIKTTEYYPVERIAPGVMTRKSVDTTLETGIKAIDAMIPIGRGQRELIIGDRQTGKTALAIDTIINQKGKDVICIYVAIGQKNSTVARLVEKLRSNGCMSYTIVVSASASEQAPMLYISPYSGCAMAEYFMEQGKDVLIVYDDLSKHAVSYRTMSLLLKRSPGREAYPGDVFYLHSRLLERACHLDKKYGGGSITALPIVETQSGDISAYIPTNIISITDGQIFLVTELFNRGQRPAIDSGFSVSRVGSVVQKKAMKQVAGTLKIDLANYNELASFSQFGSDLDAETLKVLSHGERCMEVLKQQQYSPLSMTDEIVELFAAKYGFLAPLSIANVSPFLHELHQYLDTHNKKTINKLTKKMEFDEELIEELKSAITEFQGIFLDRFIGEEAKDVQ